MGKGHCLLKKKENFYNLKAGEFGNTGQNSWKYPGIEFTSPLEKEKVIIKNNHVAS